ncbi:hypothetical protein GGF31_000270 [Allomyces arbusculus]|nr:hypothetical protein GGF31_000270 [Allomyces arbusculus]
MFLSRVYKRAMASPAPTSSPSAASSSPSAKPTMAVTEKSTVFSLLTRMLTRLVIVLVAYLAARYLSTSSTAPTVDAGTVAPNFYALSALDAKKNEVAFEQFRGKPVLIVNVASKCGFTPQYDGLEKMYQKYKDQGLEILGFPTDQFKQELATEDDIVSFCRLNYGVSFPIMAKVEVNGDNEHPVYTWLKAQKSGLLGMTRIKWNFEKFLISKEGEVVHRYSSMTTPEQIEKDVEAVL